MDFDKLNAPQHIKHMIQSMTGFGKASSEVSGRKITVVLKTLNSKQLDLSVRLSPRFRSRELELRSLISRHLVRGKIELSILTEEVSPVSYVTDIFQRDIMAAYADHINRLSNEIGVDPPEDMMRLLLNLPGVYRPTDDDKFVDIPDDEWIQLQQLIETAIAAVIDFRKQEGLMLQQTFDLNINTIGRLLEQIELYDSDRLEQIKQRIERTLDKFGTESYDKARFEQEMIYYIEKLDINEEKNRLRNHLSYFIETMNGEPGQGKKLGFILQEIGREINTLGAKSSLAEMQQLVVRMKDELEQIKEQVLNTL